MISNDHEKLSDEPLWYKDAIIYELHVRAFCDADGDGIGDFRGLCTKLDYLQDLGITAIWLLPFYPSPLKDDGYDIADYFDVHSNYGTLRDFRTFLKEAHRRGLRVITELVVNHTSSEHPWFQRARRALPGSPQRDFYVWSDTPDCYSEARIIFKDFEASNWTWDPIAQAYYWHRFYSHQPDLNYENPKVQKAVIQVLQFWLDMGVDGLRLDAVPYLFQEEGTNCENLPGTHTFLKKLRRVIDKKYENRMLLAEANQWPEDAVSYFGDGDECHMAFHFPVMPRMFMAVQLEDRFPIIDILNQTPAIPDNCQWAVFLRNHDELTLEMVTDEDRDYMYRVYAQNTQARINLGIRRRLAPLLANRRKVELLNGLLFALPGTPVIYYADEIGMGDNIYLGDRNGVRTPMQWSNDRNAGFSRANPQKLFLPVIIDPEYHYEACNVETHQNNPHSLLWWMKRLIALRKQLKAFGRGTISFFDPANRKVLAFMRSYEQEQVLVVANLSRFVQYVELEIPELAGLVPVELFGKTEFPKIGKLPYFLTLGPHSFYYFELQDRRSATTTGKGAQKLQSKVVQTEGNWTRLFAQKYRGALDEILPSYFSSRRWFGGKARRIKTAQIVEATALPHGQTTAFFATALVTYTEGQPETYILPLTYASGGKMGEIERNHADAIMTRVNVTKGDGVESGVIFDALVDRDFCQALLDAILRRRKLHGEHGIVVATPTSALGSILTDASTTLEARVSQAEQSNTSVIYGDKLILKLFRRTEEGTSPDLEVGRFLTEKARFPHSPQVAGSIEYQRKRQEPITFAMLQHFVPNESDAWTFTLDSLGDFFERVLTSGATHELPAPSESGFRHAGPLPEEVTTHIDAYLATAELLGQRTGQLHVALASDPDNEAFRPEPFTKLYQRSLYQSIRSRNVNAFDLLRRRVKSVPVELREDAKVVLALEPELERRTRRLFDHKIETQRLRCHGDYHLGQVLHTGNDFVIIDFEGEPVRSIGERRFKVSPLRDVAGMLRSFHYAAVSALKHGALRGKDRTALAPWAKFWHQWVSTLFLRAYEEHAAPGGFLPTDRDDMALLLDVFLLEKAAYELEYELNNRPDWLRIPLRGLRNLLEPDNR